MLNSPAQSALVVRQASEKDLLVVVHRIYVETGQRLERLRRRVSEAKELQACKDFSSWLMFSGLLDLFDAYTPGQKFFEIDGPALRRKGDEIRMECGSRWSTNDMEPRYDRAELATMHDKLDSLLRGRSATTTLTVEVGSDVREVAKVGDSGAVRLIGQGAERQNQSVRVRRKRRAS